jgi:CRP-like cAMP-binding protein
MMESKVFKPNSYIFREFETGQEAFIIASGVVEMTQTITHNGETKQKVLAVLKAGDMFGEMALIDNGLRMATARAKSEVVTLKVLSQRQFDTILKDTHPFVKKMLELELDRMRERKI